MMKEKDAYEIMKEKSAYEMTEEEIRIYVLSQMIGRKYAMNPKIVAKWIEKYDVKFSKKLAEMITDLNPELSEWIVLDKKPNF